MKNAFIITIAAFLFACNNEKEKNAENNSSRNDSTATNAIDAVDTSQK